jgi:PAS domain S-box-containing protein
VVDIELDGLYRVLAELSPQAQMLVDSGGVVRYGNPSAHVLFGYDSASLPGLPLNQLISQSSGLRDLSNAPLTARRRDGYEFPVEMLTASIPTSQGPVLAIVMRDSFETQQLIDSLTSARRVAEEANETKGRFLATASHDLRQPLQSLHFLNGALRRTVSDPSGVELLEQERRELDSMSKLLNLLLNVVQLESGTIRPVSAELTVDALFGDLRRQFAASAAEKGLPLLLQITPATLRTDPTLLHQLLQNIVGNALRYTDAGSVTLRSSAPNEGRVRLEVIDTGIGIPDAVRERIFEDFYQVSGHGAGHRGGTGLGLGIVRRVARLLDIRLEVSSRLGQGTRFALAVPAAKPLEAVAAAPADRAVAAAQRGLIVLLEDESAVRQALTQYLRLDGHDVLAFESLQELDGALAGLKTSPDLLISDFHLGDGQRGTDAVDRLEARFGAPPPAIVLTGDTSVIPAETIQRRGLRLLNKPVAGQVLSAAIQELLTNGR